MSEIPKIVKLLGDPSVERRMSAAVVLGALKAKGTPVRDGLLELLDQGAPEERRVALDALGQLGIKTTLPVLVDHLSESNALVREAAERAVLNFGEAATTHLEKARERAEKVDERRALDAALARVGGQDAFGVLLENLAKDAAEGGREAALSVRQRVKGASAQERKSYQSQTIKFLKRKDVKQDADALKTGLKILGYLEDKKAIEVLLDHLTAKTEAQGGKDPRAIDDGVRMEAIIALRFSLGSTRDHPAVVDALLTVVEEAEKELARAAIDTLTNLDIPPKLNATLGKLAGRAHPERARFATEKLRLSDENAAKKALVDVLLKAPIDRAEFAGRALEGEKRAMTPLLSALDDPESLRDHAPRVVLIGKVLSSVIEQMTAAHKKKLIAAAVAMVEDGTPGYESVVKTAREADAAKTGDALRELAAKLRKKKKGDKASVVLGLLEKGGEATDEDRFRRAMLELKKSKKDTKPQSRARDPSLKLFAELVDAKVDLWPLLKKERSLDNEERFYLGWHFIEEGDPLGEELLGDVVKRGPRTKLARMAKNKMKLEQEA